MPAPVNGVNELVLEVGDLEAAERFYVDVLDFPVIERWSGPQWNGREAVWVLAGPTRIGLWRPQIGISRGRGGVHVHYAVHVGEEDYAGVVERIRARGRTVDEVEFGGRARSAYVTDPDGNVVEFWDWDARDGAAGPPRAVTEGIYGL
ncbi:VOC family protein [Nocardiopsis halophila]|uniref:VOC family protein n=1 Tax=Nocardiopsis halophila TaxID=141692 RepID=UPI00034A3F5C|nr:VOC family protein [Nocardiopsis halophila]